MWNLKYDMDQHVYETDSEIQRTLGEGRQEGMDWEFRISRCKVLYIDWISNMVLLYSTGSYIQYPVVDRSGKYEIYQFSSVTKLCPTVCDPMNCNMPGFPFLHYLPEFA